MMENVSTILILVATVIAIIYHFYALRKQKSVLLEEMKTEKEKAVKKSQSVRSGKTLEHIIPFFPDFDYNPSDVRFMGAPIDFVVFDGLSEGTLKEVVFIELKTGKSHHIGNVREQQVRDRIKEGKVSWRKLHYAPDKQSLKYYE